MTQPAPQAAPRVTWYVCDLRSGQIQHELPLSTTGPVQVRVGREESVTFNLPVTDPACPHDWGSILVGGRSMIVLTLDDEPVQGWAVIGRKIGDPVVPVTAATLEHCLGRSYVPELDVSGMDYSDAAAALVSEMPARFGFLIEAVDCGKVVEDRAYSADEDRKILAAMQEDIMATPGGPEWRIIPRWNPTRTGFAKVIEIRPRVGVDRVHAIFDLDADGQGSIETYTRDESFAETKGATLLTGTSEGSGESRPMTDPQLSTLVTAAAWPVWEERKNFTGLDAPEVGDEDAELLVRTRATLAQRERGSSIWAITGTAYGPQPGRDYLPGDTVHIDVSPQTRFDDLEDRLIVIDPDGGTAAPRLLGFDLDLDTMRTTPILWDADDTETA